MVWTALTTFDILKYHWLNNLNHLTGGLLALVRPCFLSKNLSVNQSLHVYEFWRKLLLLWFSIEPCCFLFFFFPSLFLRWRKSAIYLAHENIVVLSTEKIVGGMSSNHLLVHEISELECAFLWQKICDSCYVPAYNWLFYLKCATCHDLKSCFCSKDKSFFVPFQVGLLVSGVIGSLVIGSTFHTQLLFLYDKQPFYTFSDR